MSLFLAATAIGVALTLIETRSERIARLTQEAEGFINDIREGYDNSRESIERLNEEARTHEQLTAAAAGNVKDTAAAYLDLVGNQQLLLNPSDTAREILGGSGLVFLQFSGMKLTPQKKYSKISQMK